jgi:hypothetical protein
VEIGMNLKKVILEMSISEVQQILATDLDRDAEKALVFYPETLAKQVKKALQCHRVPVLEARYGPAQKDRFTR